MRIYLDTVICVYLVDGPPAFQTRADRRFNALVANGDIAVVSDLTWLECRVKPVANRDQAALRRMETFLSQSVFDRVQLSTAVYERALTTRANNRFKLADALHLATAVETGCDAFLTNDIALAAFTDIAVELLP